MMIVAWECAAVVTAGRIAYSHSVLQVSWLRRAKCVTTLVTICDWIQGAINRFDWTQMAAICFFHLLIAGLLVFFLRLRTAPRPFEATTAELRRDLDALGTYSGKTSTTSQR